MGRILALQAKFELGRQNFSDRTALCGAYPRMDRGGYAGDARTYPC
jgi:hypothetical protein